MNETGQTHDKATTFSPANNRDPGMAVAKIVAEVFSPPWVAVALLGLIAARMSDDVAQFLQAWLSASFFLVIIPLGVIIFAVKRGRISDLQVSRAKQRYIPFTAVILSAGTGVALLIVLNAPKEVLAVILGAVGGVIVALPITPFFKLSIHTASVAGSAAILAIAFNPWLLLTGLLVPLVGWARTKTSHHTAQQAAAGAGIGAILAAAVYGGFVGL